MKNIFLALMLFLGLQLSFGQSAVIYGFSGYTFGSDFDIDGGTGRVDGGHSNGLGFTFILSDYYEIDFNYSRQDARVRARSIFLNEDVNAATVINYFLIEGHRVLPINSKLSGYGGLKLGAVVFQSFNNDFSNITNFAGSLNGASAT
jgi:hypothetical protein